MQYHSMPYPTQPRHGLFATRSYLTTGDDVTRIAGAVYHYGEFAKMKTKQRVAFRQKLHLALEQDLSSGIYNHTLDTLFDYYEQNPAATKVLFENLRKDNQPYLEEVLGIMILQGRPEDGVFDSSRAEKMDIYFRDMRREITKPVETSSTVMHLFKQSVSAIGKVLRYPFTRKGPTQEAA